MEKSGITKAILGSTHGIGLSLPRATRVVRVTRVVTELKKKKFGVLLRCPYVDYKRTQKNSHPNKSQ